MSYRIKEIFYSLQGEGAQVGRPALFCRFSGCNLWTGQEEDRERSICQFCDTDFVGIDGNNGGVFDSPEELVEKIKSLWPRKENKLLGAPFVVLTGGEPGLQIDPEIISAFHNQGFEIALETNGTIDIPRGIDWVCVSPKAGTKLKVQKGNELKIVFPQKGLEVKDFEYLPFDHFFLQPLYNHNYEDNLHLTLEYCFQNPIWKLSLQIHKVIGIP